VKEAEKTVGYSCYKYPIKFCYVFKNQLIGLCLP
jgi:hypothetical protein